MKKINKEEFNKLKFNRPAELLIKCAELKKGEYLKVEQKEYKHRSPIFQFIGTAQNSKNGYLSKKDIRISIKSFDEGWVLKRIK